MGHKSRSNYPVGVCLRECANRDVYCHQCFGNKYYVGVYVPRTQDNDSGSHFYPKDKSGTDSRVLPPMA